MIDKKSPGNEYYLLPPRQQKFYQNMGNITVALHLAHHTWWGVPILKLAIIHHFLFIPMALICLVLQITYLYVYFSELSFVTKGTLYSLIPATAITNVKMVVSNSDPYRDIMMKLMDKIHIHNFLRNSDEYTKKKLMKVERYIRGITMFLVVFMFMDWFFWVASPTLNNIKNKELVANKTVRLEICLYLWMPFDYAFDFRKWMITQAINVYFIFAGGMVMAYFDSINFIFLFHFLGHIDILRHKITTYFTVKLSDKDTKERIVEIIEYHSFILSVFDDMQAGFGANIALNYLQNLVNDSLLLYQIMLGDKGNRGGYVFMMLFHMGGLILMSFVLEQIRIKTDDLALDLYQVPWEEMSTSNQKMLIPIMLKMQKILIFEGSCGLQTGVRPLANIIKSTFSYYVMLKSTL